MKALSIVIVTYRAKGTATKCLESVKFALAQCESSFESQEVIIVDSDSQDGTVEYLETRFPAFKFIRMDKNRGFAAGVNRGMSAAQGEHILVLNPDTIINAELLLGLADHLESNPKTAAVGPTILHPDGSPQPTDFPFPSLTEEIRKQWSPLIPFFMKQHESSGADAPRWISGCCMMLPRDALNEVGRFDESYFLYFEEVDWCLRAHQKNWAIDFLPGLTLVHVGGVSAEETDELNDSGCVNDHFIKSRRRYFRKHHGRLESMSVEFVHATRKIGKKVKRGLVGGIV